MGAGGVKSYLEKLLLAQIEQAGLPMPVREYCFLKPLSKHRADFAWPDRFLIVEVEGGIWTGGRHNRPVGFQEDCWKYNMAVLRGWDVLRFTGQMIQEGVALNMIREVLGATTEHERSGSDGQGSASGRGAVSR